MRFSIYDEATKKFLSESKVCLNCGKELTEQQDGYCSFRCYTEKPPNYAIIEKKFGQSINEVILTFLNMGKPITSVAKELNISHTALYRYLKKNNFVEVKQGRSSAWTILDENLNVEELKCILDL